MQLFLLTHRSHSFKYDNHCGLSSWTLGLCSCQHCAPDPDHATRNQETSAALSRSEPSFDSDNQPISYIAVEEAIVVQEMHHSAQTILYTTCMAVPDVLRHLQLKAKKANRACLVLAEQIESRWARFQTLWHGTRQH